ncbi:MAG: mechanosensitive ion channel [Bacteroidetes bacterium]|nr:mechanosensitive ion channel [Bacteroidota bacterium]MBL7102820.1 mechanosensitive ion channel [Bacteroidales bacterium]
MNSEYLEFSRIEVYFFLLIAILIFALFRLVIRSIGVIPLKKGVKTYILRFLPVIEIFFWFIYFIWAIQFFWNNNQLYAIELSLILTVLSLWIAWFALRDFIAGAIFKASKYFLINESIRVNNYTGKIISMKTRYLIIETDTGETIHIPYSRVLGQTIIKVHPAEMILSYSFKLNVPKTDKSPEVIEEIKNTILNLPWASLKKDPQIRYIYSDKPEISTFEITVYAFEKEYFPEIEKYIRSMY